MASLGNKLGRPGLGLGIEGWVPEEEPGVSPEDPEVTQCSLLAPAVWLALPAAHLDAAAGTLTELDAHSHCRGMALGLQSLKRSFLAPEGALPTRPSGPSHAD